MRLIVIIFIHKYLMSWYYKAFTIVSLGVGISLGYFSTNYFYYSPKSKDDEEYKTMHISELT